MRVQRIALCMVIGLTTPMTAGAQTYYCDRPSKPYIPMGSYSERYEMESAKDDVDRYLRDMREYLDCLRNESDDAADEAKGVLREWNDAVSSYNMRVR
jgi:hypothetical protein